jgi:hypothetical protein
MRKIIWCGFVIRRNTCKIVSYLAVLGIVWHLGTWTITAGEPSTVSAFFGHRPSALKLLLNLSGRLSFIDVFGYGAYHESCQYRRW